MLRIKVNKIKCLSCGGTAESKYRHDFVWCPCRKVAADGGKDYLRRTGDNWEDLSEEVEDG